MENLRTNWWKPERKKGTFLSSWNSGNFIESQNRWRNLWRLSAPPSLLKARSTTADCSGSCPVRFQIRARWRPHNLSEQPVPRFDHPHSRKVFCYFKWNFLDFSLCSLPLVLSLSAVEKSLAPSSYSFPSDIYTHWQDPLPPSLFLLRLNNPSSLSLSSYNRCSSLFII